LGGGESFLDGYSLTPVPTRNEEELGEERKARVSALFFVAFLRGLLRLTANIAQANVQGEAKKGGPSLVLNQKNSPLCVSGRVRERRKESDALPSERSLLKRRERKNSERGKKMERSSLSKVERKGARIPTICSARNAETERRGAEKGERAEEKKKHYYS